MRTSFSTRWSGLDLVVLILVAFFASGCMGDSGKQAPNRTIFACQGKTTIMPSQNNAIVPGAIAASFNTTESGAATISLPLETMPGRAGMEPSISLQYNSENTSDIGLGVGFSLAAGSSITRRNKTLAIDGFVDAPHFDESDVFAVDGKPLVEVARSADEIEYRTFPDSQIRVIPKGTTFEAFLPDGRKILYGAQPRAKTGQPLAWLGTAEINPRGEKAAYEWCIAGDDEYDSEYALTSIRYPNENVIVFVQERRKEPQTRFVGGMQLQHSVRLSEVQMFHAEKLVRRYALTYEISETTRRTLLTSAQLCAGNDECFAPTFFQYSEPELGFDEGVTNINAPLANKASPMFLDANHDGLPEYVVGDSTPVSTNDHPITEWRVAKNLGATFAAEKVALLQEWSFAQSGMGPADPTLIQPELATAHDNNLFLHDVTGSNANHFMLVLTNDLTFSVVDTNLPRPFPLGTSPIGLRSAAAATHLVDLSNDAMADLLECNDHGDTSDSASLSEWTLRVWQPSGFSETTEMASALSGIPCNVEFHAVDTNADGITEVVLPGYLYQGGIPIAPSGTYSVFRRDSKGVWTANDTGLPTPQANGRTLFVDVNGDGLPDALQSGTSDNRLFTLLNTGKGFSRTGTLSLATDTISLQTKYFALAQAADFDGDQRTDVLLPMLDQDHPTIPHWVILRATGNIEGPTFELTDAGIPFEAILDEDVTLADPRVPRMVDVDNDGAPDIAHYLQGKLHIFKNRAADADVLIDFSDGTNDHDIDDPAFVPNVSFSYGHLTDDGDLYNSRDDVANGSAYPRHAAVGPKRVVKEYAIHDGVGGQRHYGLKYRDGRYDRELQQWLGFGKRILTDLDTGETTVDYYENVTKQKISERTAYPFLGQVVAQWEYAATGNWVEMTFAEKTYEVVPTNDGQTYFTIAKTTHTRRMQGIFNGVGTLDEYVHNVEVLENATMLSDSTVEVLDVDEFHNILEIRSATQGVDATKRVARSVKNDLNKWQLGLPDTQTECSTGSVIELCRTITRTTNAFGEVETEKTSSSDNLQDTELSVSYERNAYGNIIRTSAEDGFGKRREETTIYDANGVYPQKRINALGHETLVEYDAMLGVLRKETDANGLVTEWDHDGFGRVILEKRPDESSTSITRSREVIDGIWRTKERVTTTGGADDETILDSLNRPIKTFTFGPAPNGESTRIMRVIEYDRLAGEVKRQSVPVAETTPLNALQFDEYDHDVLGRVIRHETPWGAITTTKYDGLSTEVTVVGTMGETPQVTKTTTDTLGRPITVTDAHGGLMRHGYGPFSQLRTMTGPDNVTMTWTRDAFNRVTRADDPNRGTTTFINDGFGDLVSSTDALGRTVLLTRDALGRPITRTDSLGASKQTRTWQWDTAPNGKGLLHSVTNTEAVKTYAYTAKGQLERLTLTTSNDSFSASWIYDTMGRLEKIKYPQPLGEEPFEVSSDYDQHGFVVGVRSAATKYWELTDVDDAGRFKSESFGNGVTTTWGYDPQKQTLKNVSTMLAGSPIQQLSWDYDGRLQVKAHAVI